MSPDRSSVRAEGTTGGMGRPQGNTGRGAEGRRNQRPSSLGAVQRALLERGSGISAVPGQAGPGHTSMLLAGTEVGGFLTRRAQERNGLGK